MAIIPIPGVDPTIQGRWIELSLPRRFVSDLLHFAHQVPSVPSQRRMHLADVIEARRLSRCRVSWCAIFVKAFAIVAAARPELRRCYLPWIWPHLYEHPINVASFTLERDYRGEPGVFFGRRPRPEERSLRALDALVRHITARSMRSAPSMSASPTTIACSMGRRPRGRSPSWKGCCTARYVMSSAAWPGKSRRATRRPGGRICPGRRSVSLLDQARFARLTAQLGAVPRWSPQRCARVGSRRVQPFIRYEVPDRIVMASEPCRCGSRLPRIERIEGRSADALWFPDACGVARPMPGLLFHDSIDTLAQVREWRAIQHGPDRVTLEVEWLPGSDRSIDREALRQRLRANGLPESVHVELKTVERLAPDPKTGKFKRIVSHST